MQLNHFAGALGNVRSQLFRQLSLLLYLVLASCTTPPERSPTLFERMGGMSVITAVAGEIIDQASTDSRTMRPFEHTKLKALKESVASQLCHLSGGPCVYEGETMGNAHHDSEITEAEFDAFVDIARQVLDRHVPTREKNELLRILAPMKRDIVSTER